MHHDTHTQHQNTKLMYAEAMKTVILQLACKPEVKSSMFSETTTFASTVSVCNPCASEPTMHECVYKLIIKHLSSGQANMDAKKLEDKPSQTSLIKFKPVYTSMN